jgi:pimeloyl-ACP methyl ester carboxylesterase
MLISILSLFYSQLSFVGHSQGATLMLMLLSTYQKYNRVVSVNVDIAPVVFVKFVKSPALISFFSSTRVRRFRDCMLGFQNI